jgi:ferrochelatase
MMCEILDKKRPESAPHLPYIAFRYADPLTEETLVQMKEDGITRAIAFSQFPQWSCTTTGSSMNELWRKLRELDMVDQFKWSAIDRWHLHPGFIDAVTDRIAERMLDFDEKDRDDVVILFSAHSVPMKVVEKGDHYVPEVSSTVHAVMQRWQERAASTDGLSANKHVLAWQSKVQSLALFMLFILLSLVVFICAGGLFTLDGAIDVNCDRGAGQERPKECACGAYCVHFGPYRDAV